MERSQTNFALRLGDEGGEAWLRHVAVADPAITMPFAPAATAASIIEEAPCRYSR